MSRRILFMLAVCVALAAPLAAFAKDKQSDQQCTAGGVVGQPCTDNTNGYTTAGHCTHIMVCAADKWPKAPRGCQPGQVAGRDCPYGSNPSGFVTGAPSGIAATTTAETYYTGTLNSDALINAFGTDSGSPTPPNAPIVGSASIAGIEYLITADSEALQVGEPLTPAPQNVPLTIGTSYTLSPKSSGESIDTSSGALYQLGSHAGASFGSSVSNNTSAPRSHDGFAQFFGFRAPSSFQQGSVVQQQQSIFAIIYHAMQSAFQNIFGTTK